MRDKNTLPTDIHTFIITSHKDTPFIEECIKSLLNQTIKSLLIISAPNSTDFLTKIADKYKILLKINPDKSGTVASNWNFALSCINTQFCTIAHQDDIYFPPYTEILLSQMSDEKDSLIGFTDSCDIKNNIKYKYPLYLIVKRFLLLPFYLKKSYKSNFIKKLSLCFGCSICCPSVMFNLHNLRKFKFSSDFLVNVDWDAWSRIAELKGSFIFSRKKLLAHRIHCDSATSEKIEDLSRQKDDLKMYKRYWPSCIASFLCFIYSLSYRQSKNL
jgi:glycosyltransferase involved in cell wall biosynthesis